MIPSWVFAGEIHVAPEGPVHTLREALRIAHDGDHIFLGTGTYREGTITVTKSVWISGEGHPVLDGEHKYEILQIKADHVIVAGITFINTGMSYVQDNAAIKVFHAHDVTIRNNHLRNNFFGIYLAKTEHSVVSGNEIIANGTRETSSGNGIHLWDCRDITVENNRTVGNRDGIYFEFVKKGMIRNNVSSKNIRYGLHFMYSDSCSYINNRFVDNGAGVAVMFTHRVDMENNYFGHNRGANAYGLLLKEIYDSKILRNVFDENSTGLYAESSNRLNVKYNDFTQNGWAVKIMASSQGGVFRHNNFTDNTFDVTTNSFQNTNTFEENYWSAYQGYDLNRNGFGDIPYRPVRLFAVVVSQQPTSLILLRSLFVQVLDVAEKVFPVLTPETLIDSKPLMKPYHDTTGAVGQIVRYTAGTEGY